MLDFCLKCSNCLILLIVMDGDVPLLVVRAFGKDLKIEVRTELSNLN
ncbi:MAG: hypothetical protein QXH57_05135 [Sulfolobales archaeon]